MVKINCDGERGVIEEVRPGGPAVTPHCQPLALYCYTFALGALVCASEGHKTLWVTETL